MWPRDRAMRAAALAAALLLPACSCGGDSASPDAGPNGDSGVREDAGPRADAAPSPLIWIDFSVTGCRTGRAGRGPGGPDAAPPDEGDAGPVETCIGPAPLRLRFVPVAPAPVEVYEWNFGDGSDPDREQSPEHVYARPGIYDVSLFGQGPGGTAQINKPRFVVVSPGSVGSACSDDSQCGSGRCICGSEPCDGLASGFCSAACSDREACDEGICADLAPAPSPVPEAWQARLCLAECDELATCPEGHVCRELRRGDGDGWVLGCFAPGLLGDIGDSCADPSGELRDSLCASGQCLTEGLRGTCSAPCASEECPPSAACATFNGVALAPSCLARCGDATRCDGDPWLACEPPGRAGPKGFVVDEKPSPAGYCAPESCDSPDDCPQGRCVNGFCGR